MAYTVKLFLTNTGLNTWTVPPDWTSVNTIECIGGGGSGSYNNGYGNGGGGGAYSKIVNLPLTTGITINYSVGTGGDGIAANAGYGAKNNGKTGGDTWFVDISTILAKGGQGGQISPSTGGQGGQASQGVGTLKYSGGDGAGVTTPTFAYGAGGSAGPNGNGNAGSGASGGSADAGFGGTGGTGSGGNGTEFDATHGSGGGGAGGYNGGKYGGGSGGSPVASGVYISPGSAITGAGGNGLIYITYQSSSPSPPIGNYKFITITGNGSYTIDATTWNSDNSNFIAVIGGGGGLDNSKYGGGGAFSIIRNVKITSNIIYYNVGTGGTGAGDDSWVNVTGANSVSANLSQGVLAKGGGLGGAGGSSANGYGDVKYSGGSGIANAGGGAAGPYGNGGAGVLSGGSLYGGTGDNGYGGAGGTSNNSTTINGQPGKEYLNNSGIYTGSGGGGVAYGAYSNGIGGLYGGGGYTGAQGVVILFWITPATVPLTISNWLTQKNLPRDLIHGSMNWIHQNYLSTLVPATSLAISQMFKRVTHTVILTSGTTWTVPSTWNNISNSIEGIGAGGTGQGAGSGNYAGGGGGYFKKINLTLTVGNTISYTIGTSGGVNTAITIGSTTYTATNGIARYGGTGINGDFNYKGGDGTVGSGIGFGSFTSGNAGGAAGPNGNGGDGATGGVASYGVFSATDSVTGSLPVGSIASPGSGFFGTAPINCYGGGNSAISGGEPGALIISWTQAVALPDTFTLSLVISTNTANFNLYDAAKAATPPSGPKWDGILPLSVTVTINSGIYVSASSTITKAFTVDSRIPATSVITIINNGYIVGAGGTGGKGGGYYGGWTNGTTGGDAVYLQLYARIYNYGIIGGGGGGGGGSGNITPDPQTYDDPGGSGGGGAGMVVGQPGGNPNANNLTYPSAFYGSAGTTFTGGAGGTIVPHGSSSQWQNAYPGGAGGDLGQIGINGQGWQGYGFGGLNGLGIQGFQYVDANSVLGDLRGQIGFGALISSGSANATYDYAGTTGSAFITTYSTFSCSVNGDIGPYNWTVNSSSINGITVTTFPTTTSLPSYTVTFSSSVPTYTLTQFSATFVFTVTSSTNLSQNISFPVTHTYIDSNPGGGGGGGGGGSSCFPAGSLVTMADGTTKPIELVKVGDVVIGAFGEHNKILALDWVVLGNRWMYQINNEHHTSDDHPHISTDKKFYACEPDAIYKEWGNEFPVILADGTVENRTNIGLTTHKVSQLENGIELQTISGGKIVDTIEKYSLPAETPLYNLVVSGSHTYFVNGYAVTGWPREDDFDYDLWQSVGPKLTIDDYKTGGKI